MSYAGFGDVGQNELNTSSFATPVHWWNTDFHFYVCPKLALVLYFSTICIYLRSFSAWMVRG